MSEGASNGARPFDIDWRAAGIKGGLENLAQHHHQSIPHSSLLLPFICLVKMFSKVFGIATLALATLANASPLARRGVSVDPAKVCRSTVLERADTTLTLLQWYTLSWDGMQYLDSSKGVLMIQQHDKYEHSPIPLPLHSLITSQL